ncbi:MAG: hypothetical protein EAZ95_10005 [Bacteroidetes bacterium]|nr:MAG: hypothetical protein EAZ95_10005 [Bacteroidota bacterium]
MRFIQHLFILGVCTFFLVSCQKIEELDPNHLIDEEGIRIYCKMDEVCTQTVIKLIRLSDNTVISTGTGTTIPNSGPYGQSVYMEAKMEVRHSDPKFINGEYQLEITVGSCSFAYLKMFSQIIGIKGGFTQEDATDLSRTFYATTKLFIFTKDGNKFTIKK